LYSHWAWLFISYFYYSFLYG